MKEFLFSMLVFINLRGLVIDLLIKKYLKGLLDKAVKSTKTPFDDMALASLWPVLLDEAEKAFDSFMEKLKKENEVTQTSK